MIPRKIAVITPVGAGADCLSRAIDSVAAQTLSSALHIVVFDGVEPCAVDPRVQAIFLPVGCEDTGATPRAIGANLALAQHCDGLAFLDADNSWAPEHLETLVKLARHFDVTVADRHICDLNDELMFQDYGDSDGKRFADTNCFLLTGGSVQVARQWGNVPRLPGVRTAAVDRELWKRIRKRGFSIGRTGLATVYYRSRWLAHYRQFPERAPPQCKVLRTMDGVITASWIDHGAREAKGQAGASGVPNVR